MSSQHESDNHIPGKLTTNSSNRTGLKPPLLSPRNRVTERLEIHYFATNSVASDDLKQAIYLSRQNQTSIEAELFANNLLSNHNHFEALAKKLDVEFSTQIETENIIASKKIDVILKRRGPLRVQFENQIKTIVSPTIPEFVRLQNLFKHKPEMRQFFIISPPDIIREAVWRLNEWDRADKTTKRLLEQHPAMSAKFVLTNWQSFFTGIVTLSFFILIFLNPGFTYSILHLFLSLVYFSFNLLKLSAGVFSSNSVEPIEVNECDAELPIYTILVALYDEEPVAQQLIQAMSRFKWPKSKLDIKLICEVNDTATINALKACKPGQQFEIILVPEMDPKTKPKALQYAMHGARGDFIAVYDAEDRPNPNQLLEAFGWFKKSSEKLACMQAPLVISNAAEGWLAALFSLEYSGLFRKLIPLLSFYGLPIPLGGTSNHFRKTALEDVGGWDPCNVTEDADLGIRLYRNGYYTGVLKRPTLETAPTEIPVWIKQRTRWLKGWMQTWLVFMRSPISLITSNGFVGFITMQILVAGMLIAALAHPFAFLFIVFTAYKIATGVFSEMYTLSNFLIYLDIFNLFGGYLIFAFVGWSAMIPAEKSKIKPRWLFLPPIYWLLMSFAGWRALSQLPQILHLWEKTPHLPAAAQKSTNKRSDADHV